MMKILSFSLLLLPLALAAEWNFDAYVVTIDDNDTLKSIHCNENHYHKYNNELMDLSNLGLKNVDENVNVSEICRRTQKLNLNNNWFSSVPKFVSKSFPNLRSLSIANNEITDIAEAAFADLESLGSLDISNNSLTQLGKHQFYGLPKYHIYIYTQGNNITNVSTLLFDNPYINRDEGNTEKNDLPIENVFGWLESVGSTVEFCFTMVIPYSKMQPNELPEREEYKGPPCRHIKVADLAEMERNPMAQIERLPAKKSDTKTSYIRCFEIGNITENTPVNFGYINCAEGWENISDSVITIKFIEYGGRASLMATDLLNGLPANFKEAVISGRLFENNYDIKLITNKHLRALIIKDVSTILSNNGPFREMNLETLVFDGGFLKDLSTLAPLPTSITKLSITDNNVEIIPAGIFSTLKNLQSLDLSKNRLTKLEPGTFVGLTSLKHLNLLGNKIQFYKGIFTGLKNIEFLNIGNNSLKEITGNLLFAMPDTLKTVILDGNEIETLNERSFVRVPKHTLSLAGNKIDWINKKSFNLPTLKKLLLAGNKITKVDVEGLRNLEVLDLSGNPVTQLNHEALSLLPMIKECIIKMSGTLSRLI